MAISLPERTASAVDSLTPRQIVAELDKYVVGQHHALPGRAERQLAARAVGTDRLPLLPPGLDRRHLEEGNPR